MSKQTALHQCRKVLYTSQLLTFLKGETVVRPPNFQAVEHSKKILKRQIAFFEDLKNDGLSNGRAISEPDSDIVESTYKIGQRVQFLY